VYFLSFIRAKSVHDHKNRLIRNVREIVERAEILFHCVPLQNLKFHESTSIQALEQIHQYTTQIFLTCEGNEWVFSSTTQFDLWGFGSDCSSKRCPSSDFYNASIYFSQYARHNSSSVLLLYNDKNNKSSDN
jgi:hypothetical protein